MKENYEIVIVIEPLMKGDIAQSKIAEIEALVESADAKLYQTVTQKVVEVNSTYFVGLGKLEEIKLLANENQVNLIVFDGELTPSQQNNISNALDLKVITRTTLILDIFAMRAHSPEGKILVELAQLKYIYPRLQGKGVQLSRLGAGIGTRGPGETKLETDRRHIKNRIKFLENKLTDIEIRREQQHKRRAKNGVKTVVLVGYTNTGKSTLLNLLTNSEVLTKDQLFATLDPTARKTQINGYKIVMMDTVGFVNSLPPELIEAFKSTLDCAVNADLILNVCDITSDWEMQIESTNKTLLELGANAKQIIVVNKCDKMQVLENLPHSYVYISAKENLGIEILKNKITEQLFGGLLRKTYILPQITKLIYSELKIYCENWTINYTEEGLELNITIEKTKYRNFAKYIKALSK